MKKRNTGIRGMINPGCICPAVLRKCIVLLCFSFFVLFSLHPACGASKDAAMIYRIEGSGKIVINDVAKKTVLMQQLKANDRVKIPQKTSIVFLSYKDRKKYRVTGSALVKITPSGITLLQGNKNAVTVLEKNTAFLFPAGQEVTSTEIGAYTIKEVFTSSEKAPSKEIPPPRDEKRIVLLFPDVTTKTPVFRWTDPKRRWTDPERMGKYTVTLVSITNGEVRGVIFQEKNVEGDSLKYPSSLLPLQYGREYKCTVDEANAGNEGPARAASYTFRILSQSELRGLADKRQRFEELVTQDPDNPDLYALMATAYLENGLIGEALPLFEKLVQLVPGSGKAHAKLSEVYYKLGRVDEAYKAGEKKG